jgi:peptide deformylase
MILNLVQPHDPILKEETQFFDFDNPPMDPKELVDNLIDTMIAKRGVGLAAPQVGIPYSVFVIGHPDDKDGIIPVFNPKIVDYSENVTLGEEGCLTWEALFVKIKRSNRIRVRFTNMNGETGTDVLEGFTARAFQHEFDHLQGTTFLQRANRFHIEAGKRQQKKLMKLRKQNARGK